MKEPETCPTCKQPMPPESRTPNPRDGVELKCEFCPKRAEFIIRKRAVCYECRAEAIK